MTVDELIETLSKIPQADRKKTVFVAQPKQKKVSIVELDEVVEDCLVDEMTGIVVQHADEQRCDHEHVVALWPVDA